MAFEMLPKLTKFEKASKLADMWMASASGSETDQCEMEYVGRPGRAGLGIKVMPNERAAASSANPIERKIQGKLNAIKKKCTKNNAMESPAEENGLGDCEDDDDDEEPESRIKALTKKRTHPTAPLQHSAKRCNK